MRNTQGCQEVDTRCLARCERSVHTSVSSLRAVLSGELQLAGLSRLQGIIPYVGFVPNFIGRIGTKPCVGILRPVGRFQIHHWREFLVGFGAEELEQRLKEGVDFLFGSHSLDALCQRFDNLDRKLLGLSAHDPVVARDGHVGQDRTFVNWLGGWLGVENELIIVFRPEDRLELDKDLAKGTIADLLQASTEIFRHRGTEFDQIVLKHTERKGTNNGIRHERGMFTILRRSAHNTLFIPIFAPFDFANHMTESNNVLIA